MTDANLNFIINKLQLVKDTFQQTDHLNALIKKLKAIATLKYTYRDHNTRKETAHHIEQTLSHIVLMKTQCRKHRGQLARQPFWRAVHRFIPLPPGKQPGLSGSDCGPFLRQPAHQSL